jgi:hypothetical protein
MRTRVRGGGSVSPQRLVGERPVLLDDAGHHALAHDLVAPPTELGAPRIVHEGEVPREIHADDQVLQSSTRPR